MWKTFEAEIILFSSNYTDKYSWKVELRNKTADSLNWLKRDVNWKNPFTAIWNIKRSS